MLPDIWEDRVRKCCTESLRYVSQFEYHSVNSVKLSQSQMGKNGLDPRDWKRRYLTAGKGIR
jgi:hypothetical protein